MEEKQSLRGTVVGLSPDGSGVVKDEGRVVFLPLAVPGQVVEYRLTHRKKNAFFGEVTDILQHSPAEVPPFDPEFPRHGGAPWQHIAYAEQLKWKEQFVKDAFLRIGHFEDAPIEAITKSPVTERYRNKMEFSFGYGSVRVRTAPDGSKTFYDEDPGLGLHKRGNWKEIVRISDTLLAGTKMLGVRALVEAFALESGWPVWNPLPQKGGWRELIVRESVRTGECLVEITYGRDEPAELFLPLAERLKSEIPGLVGVLVTYAAGDSVVPPETPKTVIWGRDHYFEAFCGLTFKISAGAFFQVNTAAAESLAATVADFADLHNQEHLLDLFCGTGTLGLAIAHNAASLTGIELSAAAVADARENAQRNGITHAEFFCGPAEILLKETVARKHFHTVIVDPPRAGLPKKAREILTEIPADRMVMVSCNPATLARDLLEICPHGWQLTKVRPHDLFPHTPHVETVAVLERKPGQIGNN